MQLWQWQLKPQLSLLPLAFPNLEKPILFQEHQQIKAYQEGSTTDWHPRTDCQESSSPLSSPDLPSPEPNSEEPNPLLSSALRQPPEEQRQLAAGQRTDQLLTWGSSAQHTLRPRFGKGQGERKSFQPCTLHSRAEAEPPPSNPLFSTHSNVHIRNCREGRLSG